MPTSTPAIYASVILAAAIISPLPSASQVFGLNMGESVIKVQAKGVNLKPEGNYVFSTPRLPKGNSLFDDYRMTIPPKSGLCKITAWISEIDDSPYGDSTKSKYNSLLGALSAKYGEPTNSFDFLRAGAIWTGSREWMMSLLQNERNLAAFWTIKDGAKLTGNLQSISLTATGVTGSVSMISVSYEFKNLDACFEEKQSIIQQNL